MLKNATRSKPSDSDPTGESENKLGILSTAKDNAIEATGMMMAIPTRYRKSIRNENAAMALAIISAAPSPTSQDMGGATGTLPCANTGPEAHKKVVAIPTHIDRSRVIGSRNVGRCLVDLNDV
jgi:hypothetical protein